MFVHLWESLIVRLYPEPSTTVSPKPMCSFGMLNSIPTCLFLHVNIDLKQKALGTTALEKYKITRWNNKHSSVPLHSSLPKFNNGIHYEAAVQHFIIFKRICREGTLSAAYGIKLVQLP